MNFRGYSNAISPQPEVLVAEGLQKSYGAQLALQGPTFILKAGHILGFLGSIGIARALINDPLVVFLDEPTLEPKR